MKTKLLTLVAAVAVSLGLMAGAGSASAQSATPATVAEANVQLAHFRPYFHRHSPGRRKCARWYRLGYVYGIYRFRILFKRYCRGGGFGWYNKCRKWYHLGFVRGIPYFRFKYIRHCRRPIFWRS